MKIKIYAVKDWQNIIIVDFLLTSLPVILLVY